MPPSPDEIKTAVVEKLVSGGSALVRLDGEVVLVEGALPGETVRIRLADKQKGVRRAELIRVEVASEHRVVPRCAHYGACGGCDLMHLDWDFQRQSKRAIVQETFQRIAKISVERPTIAFGSPWNYRSRVQFHREGDVVGFRAARSPRVVRIEACLVASVELNALFAADVLPPGRTNAFSANGTAYLEGRDERATVEIRGKRIALSLNGFFQSNLEVLELLLDDFMKLLPPKTQPGPKALDLFCGSGLFASFMADRFESVVCVEENAGALALARENVVGPLHEFHATTLERWVAKVEKKPMRSGRALADFVVVDPPRSGLSATVRSFFAQKKIERLVYVSCNPDTLARDAAALCEAGYVLKGLNLYDFYPQTSHIEAMAWFDRR